MNTILLVEDNPHIMHINRMSLVMEGYNVLEAYNAENCRNVLEQNDVDLVILDIMLPDGDGITLCREIKSNYDIPILFLSALGENDDIVTALRAGGDDYLPKPYDIGVLIARVEARLRSSRKEKRFVHFGNIKLDTSSMMAYSAGHDIMLTQKEFLLLLLLARNPERPIDKEELYASVWGTPLSSDSAALYTTVSRLNKKLEEKMRIPLYSIHEMRAIHWSLFNLAYNSARFDGFYVLYCIIKANHEVHFLFYEAKMY